MTIRLVIHELWTLPEPNASGAVFGPTLGVARNMQAGIDGLGRSTTPLMAGPNQGGGDLNGTAAQSILFGHAGTAAQRVAVPRQNNGNYCGVV